MWTCSLDRTGRDGTGQVLVIITGPVVDYPPGRIGTRTSNMYRWDEIRMRSCQRLQNFYWMVNTNRKDKSNVQNIMSRTAKSNLMSSRLKQADVLKPVLMVAPEEGGRSSGQN